MSSLPDPARHKDERGFIESILRYVPGFRGYLEKEFRRESDRLEREWMAGRLRQAKTGLDSFMHNLVEAGRIDDLPQLERVRTRLDHFISSLLAAVGGYSGFFDYVRVDEPLLDDVYQLDAKLMADVDEFAGQLQQLADKADTPGSVSGDLLGKLDELHQKLARRTELLAGLGEG